LKSKSELGQQRFNALNLAARRLCLLSDKLEPELTPDGFRGAHEGFERGAAVLGKMRFTR
jgi:hypothetical protein